LRGVFCGDLAVYSVFSRYEKQRESDSRRNYRNDKRRDEMYSRTFLSVHSQPPCLKIVFEAFSQITFVDSLSIFIILS
jgi:hypothetical protein